MQLAMHVVHVRHFATPLKVSYLDRNVLQVITGQVEFSQGGNLTHTFGENTQSVVRQVQALQLGKPSQTETDRRTCEHTVTSSGLHPQPNIWIHNLRLLL